MKTVKNVIDKYVYAIQIKGTDLYAANGSTGELTTEDPSLFQTYRFKKLASSLWDSTGYEVVRVENIIRK